MTQSIITYYIPQNLHITSGKIYNLYLNKVTNLDLSSIIPSKNITIPLLQQNNQNIQPKSNISLTEEDYTNILALADTSTKLYNQSQELVKKISRERGK